MRVLWWTVPLLVLAGCSDGPSLLDQGNCMKEDVSEDPGDDVRGVFWDCEEVSGHGVHTMRLSCAEGIAGVEFDDERANGTVRASLSASNGTFWEATVAPGEEAFGSFDGNKTVRLRIETSDDFTAAELSFGMFCWGGFDF